MLDDKYFTQLLVNKANRDKKIWSENDFGVPIMP
jgi:hypothetical protein